MSLVFENEKPKNLALAHSAKGGQSGELGDLRDDVEKAIVRMEARNYTHPEIDWIDGGAPAVGGGDAIIKGRNLLQGQTFATLTLFTGTSELVFTALKPGADGNAITIALADGGTAGSEAVAKTGNAFVITIEVGVSTADQIATAVNADGADSDGYLRCNGGGAGTSQIVTAATAMTGGVGKVSSASLVVSSVFQLTQLVPMVLQQSPILQ